VAPAIHPQNFYRKTQDLEMSPACCSIVYRTAASAIWLSSTL
jgi:hypothetical protein